MVSSLVKRDILFYGAVVLHFFDSNRRSVQRHASNPVIKSLQQDLLWPFLRTAVGRKLYIPYDAQIKAPKRLPARPCHANRPSNQALFPPKESPPSLHSPSSKHRHGHQNTTDADVGTEPLADARQLPEDADRSVSWSAGVWASGWVGGMGLGWDEPVFAAVHEGREDVVCVGAGADAEEQAHEERFEVEERGLVGG